MQNICESSAACYEFVFLALLLISSVQHHSPTTSWSIWLAVVTANGMWVINRSGLPIPYKSQRICRTFFTASGVLSESLCAVKPWQWSWFVVVFWHLPCLTVWHMLNIANILSSPCCRSPRLRNIHRLSSLRGHSLSSLSSRCRLFFTLVKWLNTTRYNVGLQASLLESVRL